jgi:hypothetical protein
MVVAKAFLRKTEFNLISEWQHTQKALNDSFAIIKSQNRWGSERKESPYHLSLLSFFGTVVCPEKMT